MGIGLKRSWFFFFPCVHCLVGLVVKVSSSRAANLGFDFCLHHGDFSMSIHTSDSKIDSPVATLPSAWHRRVSTGTGWPGVGILWLDEVESLICNVVWVWQHVILSEQIRPWDTLACCWDIKRPSNKQTLCSNFQWVQNQIQLHCA